MSDLIKSRSDLKKVLAEDALHYPKLSDNVFGKWKNVLVTNPINTQHKICQYVIALRKAEYHENNSVLAGFRDLTSLWHTLAVVWYYYRLRQLSYKVGVQIPTNVCGPGLQIWHYGHIIVNPAVRIGSNLTIYPGVEIGHKVPGGGCPVIGDDCYIGAGAKIFGEIRIGNNVTVAPNAVVMKDVPDNVVVGGIPAKIIKYKSDEGSAD